MTWHETASAARRFTSHARGSPVGCPYKSTAPVSTLHRVPPAGKAGGGGSKPGGGDNPDLGSGMVTHRPEDRCARLPHQQGRSAPVDGEYWRRGSAVMEGHAVLAATAA